MKSTSHLAGAAIALFLAACGPESASTGLTGSPDDNSVPDTAQGLEEFAIVLMLSFTGGSDLFAQDIESIQLESQSRCLSGSLTVNSVESGNFDSAIRSSLNNCESVAGATPENGVFSTFQRNDGSDLYVELGDGSAFVNTVDQFDDGVIFNAAFRGWFQNTRTSTSVTRRADFDFRTTSSSGGSISASLERTVEFDTTSDAGSVEGRLTITTFELPGTGNCADIASYDIQTRQPFFPSTTGNSDELGISGGNIVINKNSGASTATISFTDDGHIRVTKGSQSEIFGQTDLENLCGSSSSR